jgi:hypothetical protein
MKTILLIAVMLAPLSIVNTVQAQQTKQMSNGWTKIGEVSASYKLENESILATGTERYRSIKLIAADKDLNLQNIEIYYQSGEMEEISIRKLIPAQTGTADLVLRPNKLLKKVVFSYKSPEGSKDEQVLVELLGQK